MVIIIIITIIIIIILCASSKHAKIAKFEFVTLDITRKNYLYWILNIKCWNTFRCHGSWWYH